MKISIGDPAPSFKARSNVNHEFNFGTAAGRYVVLTFMTGTNGQKERDLLGRLMKANLFDGEVAGLFLVTNDPAETDSKTSKNVHPGVRVFYDDGSIAELFGLPDPSTWPVSVVISPRMQVLRILGHQDAAASVKALVADLRGRTPPAEMTGEIAHAPVLMIPSIFEPELCRALIEGYKRNGGTKSGFMRDVNGRTVEIHDNRHKIRRDWMIEDEELRRAIQDRFARRVVPEIKKAFQFNVTRLERYLVACYTAEEGGHFRAHRDNTTRGTAHRRFAISVNLDTTRHEGGDLRLPEFGPRSYRAPSGGGIVFSCSLLHEALPVTSGERYAFLPFLHDEAAAAQRAQIMREDAERAAAEQKEPAREPAASEA